MRRRERRLMERRGKAARRLTRTSLVYLAEGRYWDLFRHIVFRRLAWASYYLFGCNVFKRWTDSKHRPGMA